MPNTKSAKKALKRNEKKQIINQSRKSALKTALKAVSNAIEAGQSKELVMGLLSKANSVAARAASKKVIHKNTAARKISRLAIKASQSFIAEKK
jgi:small subunit ribosomal protein S20